MIIDGLSWNQFVSLPHIVRLPMSEQIRAYDIYNQTLIQEVLAQQYYNQQVVVPNTAGGGIDLVEQIVDNYIEFIADSIYNTYFEMEIEVSSDTTYTVDWGDGVIEDGTLFEGTTNVTHDFPENSSEVPVRITFADPNVVIRLYFYNND